MNFIFSATKYKIDKMKFMKHKVSMKFILEL